MKVIKDEKIIDDKLFPKLMEHSDGTIVYAIKAEGDYFSGIVVHAEGGSVNGEHYEQCSYDNFNYYAGSITLQND